MLATDLIHLPVAAIDINSRVGFMKTLLIDTDRSIVIGFLVSTGLFHQSKFLSIDDILSVDQQGIVVRSVGTLAVPNEVIQAQKILEKGIMMIRHLVKTERGQRVGRVSDLLIDLQTGQVTKYYIHGWLSDRIIPIEKVIKITHEAVIIEDEEPVKAEPAAATA